MNLWWTCYCGTSVDQSPVELTQWHQGGTRCDWRPVEVGQVQARSLCPRSPVLNMCALSVCIFAKYLWSHQMGRLKIANILLKKWMKSESPLLDNKKDWVLSNIRKTWSVGQTQSQCSTGPQVIGRLLCCMSSYRVDCGSMAPKHEAWLGVPWGMRHPGGQFGALQAIRGHVILSEIVPKVAIV